MSYQKWIWLLLLTAFSMGCPSYAAEPCDTLIITPVAPDTNIFTGQQEKDLGEAISASMLQAAKVIPDASVTATLQTITGRLHEQVPAGSRVPVTVLLFESSTADAFSIPGRIYISRKLVAMTRSEDEMAGVLAHELGHMLAHHSAIAMSEQFRAVLHVSQVGDRNDINDKWNQYLNNYRRQHVSGGYVAKAANLENREQLQADTIALYLVTRAGYSPQSFVDFFDRIAETKGNTGGFWNSLFGNTRPDSKRLREMIKNRPPAAAACIAYSKSAVADYSAWRDSVMAYKVTYQELLPGLISKQALKERLRPDIEHLRISPDGRYVLAQDESNVFVLTRSPLKPLFRIDASGAQGAQFSPDSRSIVFQMAPFDSSPRVERWDIGTQKRTDIYEIYVRKGCLTTALSPDGRVLGCLTYEDAEHRFDYDLFDTASGKSFWHKKGWFDLVYLANTFNLSAVYQVLFALQYGGDSAVLAQIGRARFSPDGHYFLAHSPQNTAAIDLTTRSEIGVSGGVKDLLDGNFIFLSSNRIFGYSKFKEKCAEVGFPSGEPIVKDLVIGNLRFERAGRPDTVLLHTRDGSQVGIYDLSQKKLLVNSRRRALDVWEDRFISEGVVGDVVVFTLADAKQIESVELPEAPLGTLVTAGLSPDLNWLAVSQKSRGGVWNLQTGKRMYHLRGFEGGYFVPSTGLYTVFPKYQQTERTVALLGFDGNIVSQRTIAEKENSYQLGKYMVVFHFDEKNLSHGYNMELHDLVGDTLLWSKDFSKERPEYSIDSTNNTLMFHWRSDALGLRNLAKEDSTVSTKLAKFPDKSGVDYLEILNLDSGKARAGIAFDTGKRSVTVGKMSASGDNVVIADTHNRLLLYTTDGTQRMILTGTNPSIAPGGKRLMVRPDRNHIALYDLATLLTTQNYEFPSRVSLAAFSEDGDRLLVVTADQVVYTFDLKVQAAGKMAEAGKEVSPQAKK